MTKDKTDDPPFGRRDGQIDAIVAAQNSAYESRPREILVPDIPGAQRVQSKIARDGLANKNKPAREALLAAIVAERGDGPPARPSKEAAAILGAVNRRIELAGFEPVSVDVIYRQLKKFPRS
jgi:hypothetical protein